MTDKQPEINVLIVCQQRQDRRVLFDALDSMDLGELYTAKSIDQAGDFLKEGGIDLLVLELGFEREAVEDLLDTYLKSPDTRLLVVLPPEERQTGWSWEFLPRRVTECLKSPVDHGEVVYRLKRMLGAPGLAQTSADDEEEDDLLFEGVDEEYVVSDPRTGQVLEVNQRFLDAMGGDEASWIGESFDQIGLVENADERDRHLEQLRNEGHVRYRCNRKLQGRRPDTVEVARRLGMRRGSLVYLTRIRNVGREETLALGLELLSGLFPRREGVDPAAGLGDLVSEWLDLDYFMVATIAKDKQVHVVAAHSRGEMAGLLSDPDAHMPYKKLMQGEEIIAGDDARKVVGRDRFIVKNAIDAYFGLPIFSSENRLIGVVIGARKTPVERWQETAAALRVIGGYFGLQWEVRKLREHSESQGLHDTLTGLPNRVLFNDRLTIAIKEARRSAEMMALMFVDLDRFKNINDSLGHTVGDKVLLGVAERLKSSVRASDTVARYAGDEFTIVLRHINQKDDVMRVAQKLNRTLSAPLVLDDQHELQITASIGVSFFPDDGRTPEELLKHADMAMYNAKGMGRNTCQNYVDEPDESHQQKLMLESKLRYAEANDELRVYYQPQVSTETEDIVGMEALIRWEHPELGLISPGFFIPLAEETGLIVPIGEWMLRTATKHTKRWQDRFGLPLTLGVNLSPLQLKQPNLVEVVEKALNAAELEPRYLDLEVTESLSIKSIPGLRERLGELRDLGCTISIDDFGTGQASLDYLKRFPADRIKIDQSFVRNIGVDPDDEAIVKATIEMAHSLKLGVIAEGVEEEHHLDFLRANDCEQLQGYLFCRPLPADSFSQLLVEREALTVGKSA